MILETLFTLLAAHARLARTLARERIALRRNRADRIALARLAALAQRKSPRVRPASRTIVSDHARLARTLARLNVAHVRAQSVALARLTRLGHDRVAPMPVGALVAPHARRVVQALQASARSLIARVERVHVDVAVALARQAAAARHCRVAVEAGRASLAELAIVAGCARAMVDFLRVRVVHTRVSEDVRLVGTRARTQSTFAHAILVLDLVVAFFAAFAVRALCVVAALDALARLLVARVRVAVAVARHAVEQARTVAFHLFLLFDVR